MNALYFSRPASPSASLIYVHLPPPSQENLFSNQVGPTQLDMVGGRRRRGAMNIQCQIFKINFSDADKTMIAVVT